GREGRVTTCQRKNFRIFVEGVSRDKGNGATVPIGVNASNVVITKLKLDKDRKNSLSAGERAEVTAALETLRSDETMDLGVLGVGLGALLLRDDLATDDKLADVVRLVEVEEPTDLGRALRAEALGEALVGQPGDGVLALLDDDEVEGADVGTDDATADRLALALAGAAGAVARVALGEEEADTVRDEDSLLQRETLLVVTAGDPDDVALELVAELVGGDLLSHALLVKDARLALIVDLDSFLLPGGRVGEYQLHDI
ncbi:50S ribosomal protein L24, partial [Clostridioides difficile]|nr:50S ribosomal protein L24 [Clostridioides difficile]